MTRSQSSPRRILSLSGGGVRGIVEVAFLEAAEAACQRRFGQGTRLCDVFHLVGGTSTGALIATAIALGLPLSDIRAFYLDRAATFFSKRRWRGLIGQAPLFDGALLEQEFRSTIGDVTLGDQSFRTYLAIVTKRLDTGSPWILNNIPSAPYFDDPPDGSYTGNRHYDVARILRAATAAPTFFDQQTLDIGDGQQGTFVDGGLSPYNDPSLALLRIARVRAFGLNWAPGADQLGVLSVGAGRFRQRVSPHLAARLGPLRLAYFALRGMAGDAETDTLAMMQWLGKAQLPEEINSELGTLADEHLTPQPAFSYLRLDLPLDHGPLRAAGLSVPPRDLRRFHRFDDPAVIAPLYDLTRSFIAAKPEIDQSLDSFFRKDLP